MGRFFWGFVAGTVAGMYAAQNYAVRIVELLKIPL
jgi:hypothetical protein